METRDLDTTLVYPNPNQPRKHFDQKALEELAASMAICQLQAILVRPDAEGKFIIVGGERRWRAAVIAGMPTIRATIAVGMSDEEMADAAIVENLQRRDITPLEEARAFQRRLDAGLTVDELAARLGMKQSWRIKERTDLLRLSDPMQAALACGIISPSQAYEMSKLGAAGQKTLFDAIGEGRCASYLELRRTSAALLAAEQQVDMFAPPPAPTPEQAERATRLERAIDTAAKAVAAGFDGNDCVALQRTSPLKASVLVDQLAIMEKALRDIRLNLAAAVVAGKQAA